MIFSDDFSVSPTTIICSNWFPAHLKRVLIFLAEVLVCDEVRQMVATTTSSASGPHTAHLEGKSGKTHLFLSAHCYLKHHQAVVQCPGQEQHSDYPQNGDFRTKDENTFALVESADAAENPVSVMAQLPQTLAGD